MKRSNVLRKFKYVLFGFLALLFAFQTIACKGNQTTDPNVIVQPEDEEDDDKLKEM